jgi:hypothetical protein
VVSVTDYLLKRIVRHLNTLKNVLQKQNMSKQHKKTKNTKKKKKKKKKKKRKKRKEKKKKKVLDVKHFSLLKLVTITRVASWLKSLIDSNN